MSVVIVSDYAGGEAKSWDDVREALSALARQEYEEPVEYLLCECAANAAAIPSDLRGIIPDLRIELSPATTSYDLKNDAVRRAGGDLVAVIDADCVPESDWLRSMVDAFERHPDSAVVSGRTRYPGDGLLERLLGLLTRSYLDPGREGPTRFISNNNSAARRDVLLRHPLPTNAGPFANRMQSEAMLRDGAHLYFEPSMRATHDFEGWPMEKDIRKNIGFGTVMTRLKDPRLPHAWLTRLDVASVPVIVVAKMFNSWRDCFRCARAYGVRWYELPLALGLSVYCHILEVPGMVMAFRGDTVADTAYR